MKYCDVCIIIRLNLTFLWLQRYLSSGSEKKTMHAKYTLKHLSTCEFLPGTDIFVFLMSRAIV